jgi:hypothetical protein
MIHAAARAFDRDPAALAFLLVRQGFDGIREEIESFEMESAPSVSAAPASASFASGFANGRHRPSAKCVNRLGLIWRRERDSNSGKR